MDKNTVIGFGLMILTLIAFSYLSAPSQEDIEQQRQYDSIAAIAEQQKANEVLTDSARLAVEQAVYADGADSASLFYYALTGVNEKTTLHNDFLQVTIDNHGAHVSQVIFNEHKDQKGKPLTLFGNNEAMLNLDIKSKDGILSTAAYYFEPVAKTDTSLVLRLLANENSYLEYSYTLARDDYKLRLSIQAVGMAGMLSPVADKAEILWKQKLRQLERSYSYENRYTNLYYKVPDDYESLSAGSNEEITTEENVRWVAAKNQYFSSVLMPDNGNFGTAKLSSQMEEEGSGYLKDLSAEAKVSFDPTGRKTTDLTYFFVPNNYKLLQSYDEGSEELELHSLVYLGWPILRWINQFFTINLFDWLTRLGLSMGLVLLFMTIIVKALVYPLTRKSYLSSTRMRVLKPQVDELNKKYPRKEDAMKKQQEMMSIYSKYGVSPMGGCLPMLLQAPIWMALFLFIPSAIELRGQSFLWADDLSTYDDLLRWDFNIPFIGNHLSLFCLLMTVTNLVYTKYNMAQQQTSMGDPAQAKMMKWMMYIMPVFFIFVLNDYASGLNYYYFLSSLTSILIMIWLKYRIKDADILAKLNEYAATAKPKKGGGMMAKLEAMQRQQEELARARKGKR